jgi:competence protein ComEC
MKTGPWKYLFALIVLGSLAIFLGLSQSSDANLHVIACDVGQGDALLLTYESTQVLIDGGPDAKVLDCLGRHVPFWDRTIEVVILTHPQLDHYGGLIEVVRRYEVENFIANSLDSKADAYEELKKEISQRGINVVNPTENTIINYSLLHLDIVHPSEEFLTKNSSNLTDISQTNVLGASTSSLDPNEFSIVARLSFGNFDALFTGDIIPKTIEEILKKEVLKDVDYIKVPHHGSKNGLTLDLLEATNPEVAVISVGKNNRFGHPHLEVISLLESRGVEIFRTDEMGDIEVSTDGKVWEIE